MCPGWLCSEQNSWVSVPAPLPTRAPCCCACLKAVGDELQPILTWKRRLNPSLLDPAYTFEQ